MNGLYDKEIKYAEMKIEIDGRRKMARIIGCNDNDGRESEIDRKIEASKIEERERERESIIQN